jgi:hypothetical protein
MRGHEIEEVGLVFGVAEAAEIVDAGFREWHGLETQNGYSDLSFIAHAAKAGGVFRPGIDLEAGAGLLREVPGMVVASGEFQIHSRDFELLGRILDAQVRETDLALDHGEVQFPCEFFLLPLQVSIVAGLGLSEPPVELPLQLLVELHAEDPAALALDLVGSLVVEAVEVGVMICFFGLHEATVGGLVFRYEVVKPDEALPSLEPKASHLHRS